MKPQDTQVGAIYSPAEASKYAREQIERMQASKYRAIRFPVPEVDGYFAPPPTWPDLCNHCPEQNY